MLRRARAIEILNKRGRPANKPNTIRFFVFALFKALDKAKKLDQVSFEAVARQVQKKFPNSKFDAAHSQWYLNTYKRLKAAAEMKATMESREPQA